MEFKLSRVKFIKGTGRVPEPQVLVQPNAYVDSWTKKGPTIVEYIYISQVGSEHTIMLTSSEANDLILAIENALVELPGMGEREMQRYERHASSRPTATPVAVESN